MIDLLAAQRRVFESDLRVLEKVVALALLDHWSQESQHPYPSVSRLARWTSLSRHGVLDALKGLKERDAIRVVDAKHGRASKYDVSPIMSLPARGEASTGTSGGPVPVGDLYPWGTGSSQEPVAVGHRTSTRGVQGPVPVGYPKEPSKEPKKEPIARARANPPMVGARTRKAGTIQRGAPAGENPEEWGDRNPDFCRRAAAKTKSTSFESAAAELEAGS